MQKNSLFRRLLITLTLTGAAICLIFMGTVFAGGTISNLKDISYHLFHQRVKFRGSAGNHGNRSVSAGYLQGTATGM